MGRASLPNCGRHPAEVFPDGSVGKESTCNAGDPGLIPGSGRSTGEGMGYPLQYSWASLGGPGLKLGFPGGPDSIRYPGSSVSISMEKKKKKGVVYTLL